MFPTGFFRTVASVLATVAGLAVYVPIPVVQAYAPLATALAALFGGFGVVRAVVNQTLPGQVEKK